MAVGKVGLWGWELMPEALCRACERRRGRSATEHVPVWEYGSVHSPFTPQIAVEDMPLAAQ